MTQIFTGSGLGTHNSSLGLGSYGPKGSARLGQGGSSVYVNATNGNCVIQQDDGYLAALGVRLGLMQTYNSQGGRHQAWRFNVQAQVELSGVVNSADSVVIRTSEDGHRSVFHYDAQQQKYRADEGGTEELVFKNKEWIYTNGAQSTRAHYNQEGQLVKMLDREGYGFSFSYAQGELMRITDESGSQTITWTFSQGLLQELTVTSEQKVIHHLRYEYDEYQRLHKVSRDLGQGKSYWTIYEYAGDSAWISDIKQSDGTSLHIDYDTQGRVRKLVDGEGRISQYSYEQGVTKVTNALGEVWCYHYDNQNRLTEVEGPEHYRIRYYYEGNQLSSIVQGQQIWRFSYNQQGDCIRIDEPNGQVTERRYNDVHQMIEERCYAHFDGTHYPSDVRRKRYLYDELGHLRFAINADGSVSEYRYDHEGRLTSTRAYAQVYKGFDTERELTQQDLVLWVQQQNTKDIRLTEYQYDWRGQIKEELHYAQIDASGQGIIDGALITHWLYDAAGRLLEKTTATDKGLSTTHYLYDDLGRLIQTTDNQNHQQKIEYDDLHQRIIQTDANGLTTIKLYDKSGLLLAETSSDPTKKYGTTSYSYDAAGRMIRETDEHGLSTYYFYNAQGLEQARVTSLGQAREYTYNQDGLLIATHQFYKPINVKGWQDVHPLWSEIKPSTGSQDRVEYLLYNQYNQLQYRINSDGAVIGYQYNAQGKLLCSTAYAQRAKNYQPGQTSFLPVADAKDRKNTYYYDSLGQLAAQIDSSGYATEYQYNRFGQLIETCRYVRAQANPLTGSWPKDRPEVREADIHHYYFYDGRGLKTAEIDGEGFVTEYSYNDAGMLREVCAFATKSGVAQFDPYGDFADYRPLTSAQDHHSYYFYDDLNRLIEEQKYNGQNTSYHYDEMGNVLTKTLTDAKTQQIRQQQYRYDAMGRVVRSVDELGAKLLRNTTLSAQEIERIWQTHGTTYEYDEAGLLLSKTNALQQKTLYFYDELARLKYTINPNNSVEEITYTPFNQVETIRHYAQFIDLKNEALSTVILEKQMHALRDPLHDSLVRYEYNNLGQLTAKYTGSRGLVTNEYTVFGELEQATLQIDESHNKTTRYQYENRGYLTQTIEDVGGLAKTHLTSYDAFGHINTQIDARGQQREFTYNKRGEQITVYKESSPSTGAFKELVYDAFGRILFETDYTHTTQLKEYSYDDQNNTITLSNPNGSKVISHFNAFGDKIAYQDGNGYTTHYFFDDKGQLIKVEGPEHQTKSYSYDALGQLNFSIDAQGQEIAYTYDPMGHILTQTKDPKGLKYTTAYSYDAEGRQLSITQGSHLQKTFSYDDHGNLVEVRLDPNGINQVTQYSYDDRGLVLRQKQINAQGKDRIVAYEWDALGRRTATIHDPEGLRLITRAKYDVNDNLITVTDANQNSTHYVYDADNQCRYSINPMGVVSEYEYTVNGALKRSIVYAHKINPLAQYNLEQVRTTLKPDLLHDQMQKMVYDNQGRIIGQYDALGYYTAFSYDGNSNLIVKTRYAKPVALAELYQDKEPIPSAEGARQEYLFYDGANQLRYTCVNGLVTESRYNRNGQLTSSTRYANKIINFTKEALTVANLHEYLEVSAEDRTTCYAYNSLGQLSKELSPEGYAKSFAYNELGQLITSTQYATRFSTPAYFDISELVLTPHSADRKSTQIYDGAGREVYRMSSEGRVIERRYDGVNNLVQEIHYAQFVRQQTQLEDVQKELKEQASRATHSEYEYDAEGRLIKEYRGSTLYQHLEYDGQGNVLVKEQANGAIWTYRYNEANQLTETRSPQVTLGTSKRSVVTQSVYDSFGNLIALIRDAEGVQQTTLYEYDTKNQKIKTTYPNVSVNNAGSKATTSREERTHDLYEEARYNAFGELVAHSDKAGFWSYSVYNQLGQLTYQINRENTVTAYEYTSFNEVCKKIIHAQTIPPIAQYTDELVLQLKGLPHNREDRIEEYSYNKDGRVIEVTRPAVRCYNAKTGQYNYNLKPTTTTLYNAFGEPVKVSIRLNESEWADTFYYYDKDGKNTAQINAGGYLTTHTYNALGYCEATTEHAYALRDFDSTHFLTPETHTQDRTVTFTYDALGQMKTKTLLSVVVACKNQSGKYSTVTKDLTTAYSYDTLGHLVATTDAQGNKAYCYYDALGQLTAKIAPQTRDGRAATTYAYDALGNLIETRKWANGALSADELSYELKGQTADDQITRQQYDAQGHLAAQTDTLNHTTYYSYDEMGNLARSWQSITQIDKNSQIHDKRYYYDREGHVLQTKTFKNETAFTTEDAQYNAFGELTAKGLNGNYTVHVDYDSEGRIWRSNSKGYYQIHVYDLGGRVTQVVTASNLLINSPHIVDLSDNSFTTAKEFNTDSLLWDLQRQNNTYDALGNLIKQVKEYSTLDPITKQPQLKTVQQQQAFDRFGNMVTFTSNKGLETHYQYNSCNQLIQQELPEVAVMDEHGKIHLLKPKNYYFYDELGQAIGMMDANGNTVSKEYDVTGRLVKEIDAKGGVREKRYNLLGQMTSSSNELGGITTYSYDKENRLLNVRTPKTQQHYVYDELGQLIQQTNGANERTQYWYDLQGHQSKQRNARNQDTLYEYDDAGHKTKETNALGHSQSFRYTKEGLVEEHIDLGGHTTSYRYNRNGLLDYEESSAGKKISYFYQGDGNLISYKDSTHNESLNYEYNDEGQLVKRESSRGGDKEGWLRELDFYEYDSQGRILRIQRKNPKDEDNRFPTPDKALLTVDYDYDAVGNIRHTKTRANYTGYNPVEKEDYFLYDENNRMTLNKGALVDEQIRITKKQGSSLAYDAAGNIKQAKSYEQDDLAQYDYVYNVDNQLELTQKDGHSLQAKVYDLAGRVLYEHLFNNQGALSQKNIMTYEDGLLVAQSVWDKNDQELSKTIYTYDKADNLRQTQQNVQSQNGLAGYQLSHHYTYDLWDSYLQKEDLAVKTQAGQSYDGQSTRLYDANGLLKESIDKQTNSNGQTNSTKYWNSAVDGIRARADKDGTTHYLSFGGKTIGDLRLDGLNKQELSVYGGFTPQGSQQKADSGIQTTAQFLERNQDDMAYGITPESTQDNLGSYTLQAGDSLDSIAYQVYGDSSLWYLIADANGITAGKNETASQNSSLHIGQRLTIPPVSMGQHHTAKTRKVLDGNTLIGNTTATTRAPLPPPPPPLPRHHNQLFSKIVVGIIATVATVLTAGLIGALAGATAAGASLYGLGTSILAGQVFGTAGTLAAGFAAGFLGNLASQTAANALKLQDGINTKGALISGLLAAATAGLVKGLESTQTHKDLMTQLTTKLPTKQLNPYFNLATATEAMEYNTINQNLALATNQQQNFAWDQLGISTITAGLLGGETSQKLKSTLKKIDYTHALLAHEFDAITQAAVGAAAGHDFSLQETLANNLGAELLDSVLNKPAADQSANESIDLEKILYTDVVLDVMHEDRSHAELKKGNDTNFKLIMSFSFNNEGDISDHKNDKGKLTNKGITFATFKSYAKIDLNIEPTRENLKQITNEQAEIIYKKRYWTPSRAGEINSVNLAYAFFDFYINSPTASITKMQEAINSLGGNILADGKLGSKTLAAINTSEPQKLFNKYQQNRINFYNKIVEKDPSQEVFRKGWIDRVHKIKFQEKYEK